VQKNKDVCLLVYIFRRFFLIKRTLVLSTKCFGALGGWQVQNSSIGWFWKKATVCGKKKNAKN